VLRSTDYGLDFCLKFPRGVLFVLVARSSMRHPELPVAMAIAAALLLIPLPAHIRLRNIPLLVLIVSTFFMNLLYLVNSLVWAGNVRDVAPVWCDISTCSPLVLLRGQD
jgi:hypothetical protein